MPGRGPLTPRPFQPASCSLLQHMSRQHTDELLAGPPSGEEGPPDYSQTTLLFLLSKKKKKTQQNCVSTRISSQWLFFALVLLPRRPHLTQRCSFPQSPVLRSVHGHHPGETLLVTRLVLASPCPAGSALRPLSSPVALRPIQTVFLVPPAVFSSLWVTRRLCSGVLRHLLRDTCWHRVQDLSSPGPPGCRVRVPCRSPLPLAPPLILPQGSCWPYLWKAFRIQPRLIPALHLPPHPGSRGGSSLISRLCSWA